MIKIDDLIIRGKELSFHPELTRTHLYFGVTGKLVIAQYNGHPVIFSIAEDDNCCITYHLESKSLVSILPFEVRGQREMFREALYHEFNRITLETVLIDEANYAQACYHFNQSRELLIRSNRDMEISRTLWLGAKGREPLVVIKTPTVEEDEHKKWERNFSLRDFLKGL